MSRTIQLARGREGCFGAFDREWGRDLKLVDDGSCFFGRIERFDRSELRRGSGGIRCEFRFILIVDDEDSRNASIVGAASGRPRQLWSWYVGADTG
jgi:hypothetical protein